jgi:glycosyltransferase involved in cell wall biosynthesis
MVRKNLPDAKLVIVGDETSPIVDGVENVGQIGPREQMKELFLASDLVIAPARCDPFQTFLLEALNFGVPCIVSHRDAMPEIIADGVTGCVIKHLDAANLAAAVVNLLSDPARLALLSEKARESAQRRFNWQTVALKIREVLNPST